MSTDLIVAGLAEALRAAMMWGAIAGITVAGVGFYVYQHGRDQVTSPAHQFVVACRAVEGTPFQSADGTLSCFSAPGAGKVLK